MVDRPKISTSSSEKELDKVEEQFKDFDNQVKELTHDRMRLIPKTEYEPQTKISQHDLDKYPGIYLKPSNFVADVNPFNEKFRKSYEYDKEYVQFIPENVECRGDIIEIWTKPYRGVPAEFWKVPSNTAVWAPRYLKDQLQRKFHHKLEMKESSESSNYTGSSQYGRHYGKIVADTTIQRLDAREVSTKKQFSMAR